MIADSLYQTGALQNCRRFSTNQLVPYKSHVGLPWLVGALGITAGVVYTWSTYTTGNLLTSQKCNTHKSVALDSDKKSSSEGGSLNK
jgi:hypothetical protein